VFDVPLRLAFHLIVELDRVQQDVLDEVQAARHISPRYNDMAIGEPTVVLTVRQPNRTAIQDRQRRIAVLLWPMAVAFCAFAAAVVPIAVALV
jgi:hypothetical protein